jgi:hypothetical protein
MNAHLKTVDSEAPAWLNLVRSQVETISFGVVQIVVHENRVVQIERTEKVRLDKPESSNTAHWKNQRL